MASSQNRLDLTQRTAIEKRIVGALVAAADAHGPITRATVSSAAKRVFSELKAEARAQRSRLT
jgi:hypothetical protein